MASIQKYQDRVNRKIYSYLCADHGYAEVVSTSKYSIICVHHKPVYLFEDVKNRNFLSFHWVCIVYFKKNKTKFPSNNTVFFQKNLVQTQKQEVNPTEIRCTKCGRDITRDPDFSHFDTCAHISRIFDGVCRLCGRVSYFNHLIF